jgi:hypothetical protein
MIVITALVDAVCHISGYDARLRCRARFCRTCNHCLRSDCYLSHPRDTARATLAPAAKGRIVFNLAWYELLAIFRILAGEGLLFAGYNVAGVSVQTFNAIAIAVVVVALNVERVQLIEALALVSMLRVANLSFATV